MTSGTAEQTKKDMGAAGEYWVVALMDFVDEMRRRRDPEMIRTPFACDNERLDAILASTIEALCEELGMETPDWVWEVPSCRRPWFVSGVENLKAICIVESPAFFRHRKIFVLGNFLSRV